MATRPGSPSDLSLSSTQPAIHSATGRRNLPSPKRVPVTNVRPSPNGPAELKYNPRADRLPATMNPNPQMSSA